MTISRVSSSTNLHELPIQAETKIENVVHIWHLAEGDTAYLLLKDGKLDCLFVRGENSFIVTIPFPSSITPEEAIDRLLEMYPILINNNSIKFIENVEELHTWDVKYGNPIDLIRMGENLKCKTVLDEEQIQKNILTPDGLSLQEKMEWVMQRHPHVYVIDGKYVVEFEEKVKTETSAVDAKTPLDMNHWCVTLLNAENSDASCLNDVCCPANWMGHSLIVIETIEEGGYFSRRADLIQENGKAKVRFFEIDRNKTRELSENKNYSKTETYSRPKEAIQEMLYQVSLEVACQKNGDPIIFYKADSGRLEYFMDRLINKRFSLQDVVNERIENDNVPALRGYNQHEGGWVRYTYNCTEYANRNLSIAGIEPPLRLGGLLSHVFFPTPVLYTGSKIKAIAQETILIASYVMGSVGIHALERVFSPLSSTTSMGRSAGIALMNVFFAYAKNKSRKRI